MIVSNILTLERIFTTLQVRDKKQLLKRLAALSSAASGLSERQIYNALAQREHACATGMGNGVAIPHARFEELSQIVAVFVRLDQPIEFDAPDAKPVDLIFLLLSPAATDTQHIKALASISRMMRKRDCAQVIRSAQTQEQIFSIIQCAVNDE